MLRHRLFRAFVLGVPALSLQACASLQPTAVGALAPRDIVTVSRDGGFPIVLQDGRFAEGRGPCDARTASGRVARAVADTIHFEVVHRAVPAQFGGRICPVNVPGYVVVPSDGSLTVSIERFDGGMTMIALGVLIAVPILMMLQEVNP